MLPKENQFLTLMEKEIKSLEGAEVLSISAINEPFSYDDFENPIIIDRKYPFLQFSQLKFILNDKEIVLYSSSTSKSYTLALRDHFMGASENVCKDERLLLLKGVVESIKITKEGDEIKSMLISISGQDIVICSGEVFEGENETLVSSPDESVLMFFDLVEYENYVFNKYFKI